jgi:hypothetical protein
MNPDVDMMDPDALLESDDDSGRPGTTRRQRAAAAVSARTQTDTVTTCDQSTATQQDSSLQEGNLKRAFSLSAMRRQIKNIECNNTDSESDSDVFNADPCQGASHTPQSLPTLPVEYEMIRAARANGHRVVCLGGPPSLKREWAPANRLGVWQFSGARGQAYSECVQHSQYAG